MKSHVASLTHKGAKEDSSIMVGRGETQKYLANSRNHHDR